MLVCYVASVVSDSVQPYGLHLADSSIQGILQARILEWVAIPPPGDLSCPGIKPRSRAFQADSLPSEPPGKPLLIYLL